MSAPRPKHYWNNDSPIWRATTAPLARFAAIKSAFTSFLIWYAEVEQRSLALDHLSAIVLVGYRNFLQQTQGRSTSTVNGHVSALRAWCAWLVERRHLGANPARGVKLVGRQAASERSGLEPNQVHVLLRHVLLVYLQVATAGCFREMPAILSEKPRSFERLSEGQSR